MNDDKLESLVSKIEREWTWRQNELINFKQALSVVDPYQKDVMSRAGVLLLYAHWEGFIKNISQNFLKCFANEDLNSVPDYIVISHLSRINTISYHKYSIIERSISSIKNMSTGSKICSSLHEIIDTESNLNSKILKNIAIAVGASFSEFETRENFIDYNLVGIRNSIAHGEGRPISEEDFLNLEKDIVVLMDIFKKNIINSAIYATDFFKSNTRHTCIEIKKMNS